MDSDIEFKNKVEAWFKSQEKDKERMSLQDVGVFIKGNSNYLKMSNLMERAKANNINTDSIKNINKP